MSGQSNKITLRISSPHLTILTLWLSWPCSPSKQQRQQNSTSDGLTELHYCSLSYDNWVIHIPPSSQFFYSHTFLHNPFNLGWNKGKLECILKSFGSGKGLNCFIVKWSIYLYFVCFELGFWCHLSVVG